MHMTQRTATVHAPNYSNCICFKRYGCKWQASDAMQGASSAVAGPGRPERCSQDNRTTALSTPETVRAS